MKQELLAPAGDIEAGYAALYYGADAVYLGLQKFSARATAENFDEPSLNRLTAYAHHLGRKVYAAVNTVLQEEELSGLLEILDICSRCRVDAVILQDLGVARVIKQSYPELEMHASTQMAVHNREGALFLQSLGFTRVVLARELTLAEIKEIAAVPGLETEAFIHGALCYSYSGLCQFSALEYGRSANRGKCLYPCRSCFKTKNGSKHIFSMKDMALEADVLKMPVTSLKIEGRKKTALYVAAVTDYYRRILDGKGADAERAENIRQIFSRPWCKFHFNGKNKEIIDPDYVGHRGLEIGKIKRVKDNKIWFQTGHRLARFDGIQIDVPGMEKPFGFSVRQLKINGKQMFEAAAGQEVEIVLPPKYPQLTSGLTVYLASATAVKAAYPSFKPRPDEYVNTSDVDVLVEVSKDKVLAKCNNFSSEISSELSPAKDAEKLKTAFETAFAKTGGTAFNLNSLSLHNPHNLFVPLSLINQLRRDLYSKIVFTPKSGQLPPVPVAVCRREPGWKVKADNPEYFKALNPADFAEFVWLIRPTSKPEDITFLPQEKVRLSLPAVCRCPARYKETIAAFLQAGYRQWEAANYWALQMLPRSLIDLCFDSSLYMLNTQAAAAAVEAGASGICFSLEDTLTNIQRLNQTAPLKTTFILYQDVPLFISAGCIRENDCRHCRGGEEIRTLEQGDRRFTAVSRDCETMLFDQRPLCFAAEAPAVKPDYYRIDFCYKKYQPDDIKKITAKVMAFCDLENINKANINNQSV